MREATFLFPIFISNLTIFAKKEDDKETNLKQKPKKTDKRDFSRKVKVWGEKCRKVKLWGEKSARKKSYGETPNLWKNPTENDYCFKVLVRRTFPSADRSKKNERPLAEN